MTAVRDEPTTTVCVNHPKRATALRCGKCEDYICTKCMVQTPVGVRCRRCAQLRRLPQFDVDLTLLVRSALAGLLTSLVVWLVVSYLVVLRYFLSILVGAAVGEVMSRLARRRTSRALEAAAVLDVVAGLLAVEAFWQRDDLHGYVTSIGSDQSTLLALVLPAVIASFVAVVKLR
jgi:hypothetical protein